jgi:hypothetical protein
MKQLRNAHDLMRDFKDEVVGYLRNREIVERLSATLRLLKKGGDLANTATRLWDSLRGIEVIPEREWPIVVGWFEQMDSALQRADSLGKAA